MRIRLPCVWPYHGVEELRAHPDFQSRADLQLVFAIKLASQAPNLPAPVAIEVLPFLRNFPAYASTPILRSAHGDGLAFAASRSSGPEDVFQLAEEYIQLPGM